MEQLQVSVNGENDLDAEWDVGGNVRSRTASFIDKVKLKKVEMIRLSDCLTANADAVGSDSHAPAALVPGDYVSFDVYSLGVKHVHGGQSKVFGAHDLYSKRDFVMFMNNDGVCVHPNVCERGLLQP